MSKSTSLLSLGYWFSAYTLGMLLHPYKSIREMMRRRVYRPLIWAPMVFWLMAWMVGMIGLRIGGGLLSMVGVMETPGWLVRSLAFFFWWLSWFLVLWQILLSYLGWRFGKVGGSGQ